MRGPISSITLLLAGCYHPAPATDVPCSTQLECPRGQICDLARPTPVCVLTLVDAAGDAELPDVLADAAPQAIPPGAKLWLRLDDDPANGVLDSSSYHHAATCTSCPEVIAGVRESAYLFTGDRVDVAANAELEPGTGFTIAAWVRLDEVLSTTGAIACKASGTGCSYGLLVLQDAKPYYYTQGGIITGATALPIGDWIHLAMTWDGATLRAYRDGLPDGSIAQAAIPSDAAQPLHVGARLMSSPLSWPGVIDELVFYDRVLTAAELLQLRTTP